MTSEKTPARTDRYISFSCCSLSWYFWEIRVSVLWFTVFYGSSFSCLQEWAEGSIWKPMKVSDESGCKITVTETSDPSMGVERGSAEEVSVWPRRGPPVHWNHSRMHACYYWFRSFMITINSFFFMINPDGFVALLGSITVSVITSGVHHPSGTLAPSNVSNANMEKTRDKWQNGWLRIGHLTITTVFQQPLCGTNYGLFVHSFIYLRRKSFVY